MEELSQEEKEIIKAYRRLVKETNSKNWIICNPEMMWSTYFVPISVIENEIEELSAMKLTDTIAKAEVDFAIVTLEDIIYEERRRNNTDV